MSTRDPKGDRLTSRPPKVVPLTDSLPESIHAAPGSHPLLGSSTSDLGELVQRLARIRGGYVKMRMDWDGSTNHITYTWTTGPHAQKYVYVRVDYWQMVEGMYLLLRKIVDVEEGRIRPSPDKYLT